MKIKAYVTIAAAILLLVFILQNMTVVDIRFLFWQFSVSRAIMILLVLLVGMVIGWVLHGLYRVRRPKRSE